jgi:methionine synthase I (cobalamin-dependent)/5,10-methylenetetrahydrofolate reductase
MALPPFLDALGARVLVCDGAMGTMLYARGVFLNRSFDELNLSQPDLVAEVHQAYVRAGADVIETNTFGANRVKLAAFGLADKVHAINVQGVRLARHAARERAYVAGAIGPLGIRVEPWGKLGLDEAEAVYREQVQALLDGGVDLFILETFRDLNEIGAALAAVRALTDLPVVAQMTTEEDGNSLDGTPPEVFAPELVRRGAQVVGVNCSVGPAAMLETVERMTRVTDAWLSAQPNAGRPREVEGRTLYLSSPEYLASYARRFIRHGVKLVGGCCGTTPEHIRQIKAAVEALAPAAARPVVPGPPPAASPPPRVEPVPLAAKSRLAHALARQRFVLLVEVVPPKGHRADLVVDRARQLKIRGVDAVNVPDAPRAGARMSALSVAVLVERQAGLETVLHYACRDRTLASIQSDLLGAHGLGLRNVLLTTGEPLQTGGYPDAASVLDVDSIGLTNVVTRLNHGLDVGGQPIGSPTAFLVGVAVNPSAVNLEEELRRFHYKVEAGAEFALTAPIYDVGALERFLKRTEAAKIPVIAGLSPFDSLRRAEYMANEVPGVYVPEVLLDRMRRAETPEAARAEGLAIAREIADAVKPMVQGLQIATPAAHFDMALALLDSIR